MQVEKRRERKKGNREFQGHRKLMARNPSRRLRKELERLEGEPVEGMTVSPSEDLMEWHVQIEGQGVYEEEIFTLRFRFSRNYPLESPEVVFLGEAPVHPHVYSNGHICLSILYHKNMFTCLFRES